MNHQLLIFPHQLFRDHPGLEGAPSGVVLVEDGLFFGDPHHPMSFHKQKLWLHRASMKKYEAWLLSRSFKVDYAGHETGQDVLGSRVESLALDGVKKLVTLDPHDFLLEKRLGRLCKKHDLDLEVLETSMFLNTAEQNTAYRSGKKRWFMADFYKHQRRRLDVLMDGDDPVGGKWSFDEDNRKKVPKKMLGEIPVLPVIDRTDIDDEAVAHVNDRYAGNPGSLEGLHYPTCHEEADRWLDLFLRERFGLFGDYEDAIVKGENWLWHGVLTPMLNIGLLTPDQIVQAALKYGHKHKVPLNSMEGFLRQIIGWREFMRATYVDHGVEMRTGNHWEHVRDLPECFYDGTTGIDPVDDVIKRVLETGYCHHIERLMILGGFMFLCELHPDQIYKWFMEMFVDSYDWVMVPNVYAMSQHADGGLITTKPYFSGSSYVKKMSNHPNGDWTKIWDGLYWRWIWNHSEELGKNPRWAMMCSMARKMDESKRQSHIDAAEAYLAGL
ncbi:MAG: cryptochrome/photolyase family protein [Phycisphaerales bacterium]|nr:cryptochrome/photolyase family protein [Phycisphaerales bacterium]